MNSSTRKRGWVSQSVKATGRPAAICRYYQENGRCGFGDRCKFSHEVGDSTHPGPPPRDPRYDKLRTWKRILDHAYHRIPFHVVSQFFKLGCELMDGDIGASQEAVKLLATDRGLDCVKSVTDHHLQDDLYSGIPSSRLWEEQIDPLFRLITHPRVVDSSVLEQQVATIYSFLLGVNASRMERVFGFIADLAATWPPAGTSSTVTNPVSQATIVELSLSVLSRIIDCNTTNMLNDSFQSVTKSFADIIDSVAKDSSNDFARLQAVKYIDYLQRRLGIGHSMQSHQKSRLKSLTREAFVLRRDLPGALSADGPRHDNDHAEISEIAIFPTYQEITTPRAEYLPTTDPSQWHIPGIRGRLDREFRLLREDTVGQLRDAVRDRLDSVLHANGAADARRTQNAARTTAYQDAIVVDARLDRNKGLELTVACRQPDLTIKMTDEEHVMWWEHCKRLQPGALVCVLDAAGMIQFCVVAESTQRTATSKTSCPWLDDGSQDASRLEGDDENKKQTLSNDREYLYVKLNLAISSAENLEQVLLWYRDVGVSDPPKRFLVEFPGVLLASFKHTLEALQSLSQKPDMPFVDLIAPAAAAAEEDEEDENESIIAPPLFARAPGFTYSLDCLKNNSDDGVLEAGLERPVAPSQVALQTGLDLTQSQALINTLFRQLSLIQGPPGTGKSHTGEKIIQVLLANKVKAQLGPIICVCYTNHALDQLLEHLLDDGIKSMIRIGSRSKSERLEDFNLRTVADGMDLTKAEKTELYESGSKMKALEIEARTTLNSLCNHDSTSSIRWFLKVYKPKHHDELFNTQTEPSMDGGADYQIVGQPKAKNAIKHWLSGGSGVGFVSRGRPRSLYELQSVSLTQMSRGERYRVYEDWLKSIRNDLVADMKRICEEHQEAKEQRDRVRQEVRLRCLQQADIIGVTTTGLARDLLLLRKLRSKVVVCEEAGEVLEAHVLTALLPSVEQAILIGDHLQLRPQIQNYELQSTNPRGAQYSLDTSLFERLVQPPHLTDKRLPVSVLDTQRRMHPSIAEMVRSTLYASLEDAENVKCYPPVVGMQQRLFWMHHEHLESGAGAHDPHDTSRSNDFEVEMTAGLVSHLVRQGHYNMEDIAVLTPYLGQLQKLRRRMAAEATFAVRLDDRDLEGLEELDDDGVDGHSSAPEQQQQQQQRGGPVAKTTLLRSVRLATVDNFQGEEAKVVVISLVRSNPENKCGFLSTSNRINVLLSRAQHGCYIIGNANTYSKVPMWSQIIALLSQQQQQQADGTLSSSLGPRLALQCPRHPSTPIHVSQPDHFAQFSPDGGCILRCDRRLSCGHSCPAPCHSDMVHSAVKCLERCPRAKAGCDHACPRVCGEKCEDKCHVRVQNILLSLPCDHTVTSAQCWQTQNPAAIPCHQQVTRTVPGCGHTALVPCQTAVDSPHFKCNAPCATVLPCGHTCRRPCHRCNTNNREATATADAAVQTNHGKCTQVCGRKYTSCPHSCASACHGDAACPPCPKPCEVRCSHSRCGKPCHEPCTPCAEETCASKCPHNRCTMPCAAPCDWVPCSKRCTVVLACGHQCPSLCGEACPDGKYCQTCGGEDVLAMVVDYYEMLEYREINLDEEPCLFPDCGHFLTKTSMDKQMELGEHYELDLNETPTAVKVDSTKPFSMDEVKVCPSCRGSLRNIARYGRIVRRAMLDEATKKFISWSNERYLHLSARLLEEQQLLELRGDGSLQETRRGAGEPVQLKLTGNAAMQVTHLHKMLRKSRYGRIRNLFLEMGRHLYAVKVEEQPFHRVAELVRHANRTRQKTTAQGSTFVYDESVIQLRGYLLALSLLLRCHIAILSDFVTVWRNAPAAARRDIVITVDFSSNLAQCETLIQAAKDTHRLQLCVEGHIYWAQLCGFGLVLHRPADDDDDDAPPSPVEETTTTGTKPQSLSREKGLAHLAEARQTLVKTWLSAPLLEAEMDAADRMLQDGIPFYTAVSAKEMRQVYAAMAREFAGTGHWWRCENGHLFTIGECGMAMELARCPECGAPVGGQSHRAVEGVRHAEDMELLARAVEGLDVD